MSSLYEELRAKIEADPRLSRRGGPRVDLSLLLFNAGASLDELWHAAEAVGAASGSEDARRRLSEAVDSLRPIFGERDGRV